MNSGTTLCCVQVFHEFAHGRATFVAHLRGTWQMLACWHQPVPVSIFNILSSKYSNVFWVLYSQLLGIDRSAGAGSSTRHTRAMAST